MGDVGCTYISECVHHRTHFPPICLEMWDRDRPRLPSLRSKPELHCAAVDDAHQSSSVYAIGVGEWVVAQPLFEIMKPGCCRGHDSTEIPLRLVPRIVSFQLALRLKTVRQPETQVMYQLLKFDG